MSDYKLLIDTNIFIGLEDPKLIDPGFADFSRTCAKHSVQVFVHEAAVEDISRDKDVCRKQISLSKLQKFQLLSGIKPPDPATLEAKFGRTNSPNDTVDVLLLLAVERGAVDFLITQDQGIHDRVKSLPLGRRVLRISEALAWLRQAFEPTEVKLPFVRERKAHEIDLADNIFDSLREGYQDFEQWWHDKCVREHRPCWTIELGNELAGICVRKNETRAQATVQLLGNKILKVCTFKVTPEFRGEKLGELLLKQALWFAQRNAYDLIYLTTQPTQTYLIQILEYYGFQHTHTLEREERVYERPLSRDRLMADANDDVFLLDRLNYPRFVAGSRVSAYCVPIQGGYHRKLFPEIAIQSPLPLFPGQTLFEASGADARTPGNTIRKVYLCRAKASTLKPGDLLFFYQSKTEQFSSSQAVTSVGVVEAVHATREIEELIGLTAKRSVYSEAELKGIIAQSTTPVKVIDFLLAGHFEPSIPLDQLCKLGIFKSHPPQSICRLAYGRAALLLSRLSLGFALQ